MGDFDNKLRIWLCFYGVGYGVKMWSRKSDIGRDSELKTCVVKFRKYELINVASSDLTDFFL